MKKKHLLLTFAGIVLALLACTGGTVASLLCHKVDHSAVCSDGSSYIYIDADDNVDSLRIKMAMGWRFEAYRRAMKPVVRTGRYHVDEDMRCIELYRRLRNGQQEPLMLTLPSVRTMERLAGSLGKQLMIDSATIVQSLYDSTFCSQYGYTVATLPALFIPNSYEMYWNTSLAAFMKRMQQENARFWNHERLKRAEELGLSPIEVSTLASIVDEETANNGEKPMIAGLYLNRLRKGMLLQADPTVKFAQGDFALRRIYFAHLDIDSPYNTYKYAGLPPGPIRIPTVEALEAVLRHVDHPYLYMCAKEDFSGTHNFAATYAEHLRNARRYAKALNERGIR